MAAELSHEGEIPSVVLTNESIEVTILAGKGADILSITDRSSGVSPLWRSRWGHHHARSAQMNGDSSTAWLMACAGGWNFLFPGGGAESTVGGGLQPMHGEASIVPWDVVEIDGGDAQGSYVTLRTHLGRSPFTVERLVRLVGESGMIEVTDRATNEGGDPFPVTWTQHPTLGAPFLDASCRIETNAEWVEADDTYALPHIPLPIGERRSWSDATDVLGRIPDRGEPRQLLSYLHFGQPQAWYRVTSASRNLAFQVDWALDDYPFAWFFQEMDATAGWPWFSNTYIMAIEPSTTWPGRGLAHAIDVGRMDVLQPGESMSKSIRASFGSAS
jgi:galactose mutarotase-like enzyme